MKKEYTIETYMGCTFFVGSSKAFDKDLETVKGILDKGTDNLTAADRFKLLAIYHPAYHKDGKIEGITSYDSSATNCTFCRAMRAAAGKNPAHICNFCYDHTQEHGYRGVNILNRHTLNMLIMSTVEFTTEELAVIDCTKINRVNSSGDTPNKTYAANMIKLAAVNPHARFAFWAKNTKDVIAAVEEVGKPENMTLVQSSPIINKPAKLAKYFDIVFTVYVTEKDTINAIQAGAGECNGHKCNECGFKCYLNGWNKGQNVAELLRTNKAHRAAIEAAIAKK